jgi:ABC-type multidrug transport system ATPase subunit
MGHDVVKEPAVVRSLLGLTGQNAAVDENLTGRENLRLVAKLTHLPKRDERPRAQELLDQFGLLDAADRPVRTYSGGMRRRLDLAAALVHRPSVLFLDEPTTGLDPASRIDLWGVIGELVRSGTTLVLTTQYLEEADRLADRICVVDHGRVIAEGTSAELKSRLGTTVLRLGLAGVDEARRAAPLLSGLGSDEPRVDRTSVELTVEEGPRRLVEALRRLDSAGLAPIEVSLHEPTLDDVFLALTGHRTEEPLEGEEGAA